MRGGDRSYVAADAELTEVTKHTDARKEIINRFI